MRQDFYQVSKNNLLSFYYVNLDSYKVYEKNILQFIFVIFEQIHFIGESFLMRRKIGRAYRETAMEKEWFIKKKKISLRAT